MALTPDKLAQVDSFEALAELFYEELQWPKQKWTLFSGVAPLYGLPQEEMPGVVKLAAVQKMKDQDWGIFLVDFGPNQLRRSGLRTILNKVVEKVRQAHANPTWPLANILFICRSENATWTLGHYTGDKPANAKLRTFGWSDPLRARTVLTRNLDPHLVWTNQGNWSKAWDSQALDEGFFADYKTVFEQVEASIQGLDVSEDRRRFTQSLFNRLMFLAFLQEKGWLAFKGERKNYLFNVWEDRDPSKPFYDKLHLLFFSGLNSQNGQGGRQTLVPLIGKVPFLNGGLFEPDPTLDSSSVKVPDAALELILGDQGLFRRWNFTVTESTPFDIDVAVDPEMLGKIFERLVTGRHESGSYYTPRPVVSFMCREGLKGYLGGYESLVDEHDPEGISIPQAKSLIAKLETVKVCDPACGSGAYLVGMLHEIFELQRILDTRADQLTSRDDYQRKLKIIQNCLYGVDIDRFAVNIAWLRLWLALVIDDKRNPIDQPEEDVALPNLDAKIEIGDALLARAPEDVLSRGQLGLVAKIIADYRDEKAKYMVAHSKADKDHWKSAMETTRGQIESFFGASAPADSVDWTMTFAEVFLDAQGSASGYDIVLANPPYVRKEEITPAIKQDLARLYGGAISGRSDLYCSFYVRGMQLLRAGGFHIFVCSSAWLDASYGSLLQRYLLTNGHIRLILDSAVEKQFSTANVNTIISVVEKCKPVPSLRTAFTLLLSDFESSSHTPSERRTRELTHDQLMELGSIDGCYSGGKWGGVILRGPDVYNTILSQQEKLVPLEQLAQVIGYIHDSNTGEAYPQARVLWSMKEATHLIMKEDSTGIITVGVKDTGNSRTFAPILFPRTYGSRHAVIYCVPPLLGKEFYRIIPNAGVDPRAVAAQLNSTLGILQRELLGIRGLGGGALKFAAEDVKRFLIVRLSNSALLIEAFQAMAARPILNIADELQQGDRHSLDEILFDALDLDHKSRGEVYESVLNLISDREARSRSTRR